MSVCLSAMAAVEALGGKDAKFGFRQIKPTAVLRRIMPLQHAAVIRPWKTALGLAA